MDKEKDLIKKVLTNGEDGAKVFLEKYQKPLLSFIKKRSKNKGDAEDILQETLVSALNSLPGFNFKSPLFSWLCAIAKHEACDFYRREKLKTIIFSKIPILEEIADKSLGPEGKYLKQELKAEIKNVFQNLNEGYFKILRLKYIDRLSIKEIAKNLKSTVKTIESRLFRAKKQFRKIWRQNH